jgi:hypothetical protein
MVWSLLVGIGWGLFMGTWEWKGAEAGLSPHTHFKKVVLKSQKIKCKPPPWMENEKCCKKNKNLKPKIDKLK